MNEITCPKCNSSRLEIINGVICRCKECETIFKLDENDIAPTPEQKNEDEKMEAEKVISEKRPEKTWKCAYCGWEVPEGVEICPNCHRKSFERFFEFANPFHARFSMENMYFFKSIPSLVCESLYGVILTNPLS